LVADGIGETLKPLSAVLADPGNRRVTSVTPNRSAISSARRFSGNNW